MENNLKTELKKLGINAGEINQTILAVSHWANPRGKFPGFESKCDQLIKKLQTLQKLIE